MCSQILSKKIFLIFILSEFLQFIFVPSVSAQFQSPKHWYLNPIISQSVQSNNFTEHHQSTWIKVSNMPLAKAEAGSIVYNNLLFVFGGIRGYINKVETSPRKRYVINFNNTTEYFDLKTQQWTSLKPKPSWGISHYGICLVEDKAWLVGGRIAPNKALINQVWIYDITKNDWSQGPSLPFKLASGALLKLGRKLHFFAGGTHSIFTERRFNTLTNYHLILNLDSLEQGWQEFNSNFPAEAQTIHASYVNLRGKFYLIGGQNGHDGGNEDLKQVYEYNPALNKWRRLADLPLANSHNESSTFTIDGRLISLAGERNGSQVLEYDLKNNHWVILDSLQNECNEEMRLIGTNAKVIDNYLIIAGGGLKSKNYQSTNATYIKRFNRQPQNQIGFLPDTLQIVFTKNRSEIIKKSAWLWALGGKKNYELDISQLPNWIQLEGKMQGVTDENADELVFCFNSSNITPQNYAFQITASTSTGELVKLNIIIRFVDSFSWTNYFSTAILIGSILLFMTIGWLIINYFK